LDLFEFEDNTNSHEIMSFQRRGQNRRSTYVPPSVTSNGTAPKLVSKGLSDYSESEEIASGPQSIAQMSNILDSLQPYSDTKIRDLPPDAMEKYRSAVTYVSVLYDTNNYPQLTELIERKYGGRSDYIPGTLGAYFGGCLIKRTMPGNTSSGCSLSCVNAVPPSRRQARTLGWTPCQENVLLGTLINGRYNFSRVNESPESTHAVIYVNSNRFDGFSRAEITQLRDMGVETVTVLSNNGSNDHRELLQVTRIGDVPIRVSTTNVPATDLALEPVTSTTPGVSSSNIWWIAIIIIVAVIILVLILK